MNNPTPRERLLIAAASGLVGFFVLLLAWLIFIRVLVGHFFRNALEPSGNLILLVLVPIMIALGASIPAWALGANLRRSVLAGGAATATFVLIDVGAAHNYAPFSTYETMAFISAVLVSLLVAIAGKNNLQSSRLVILLVLTIMFIVLRFVLPGRNLLVGPIIALLAWIFLPFATAYFTMPENNANVQ